MVIQQSGIPVVGGLVSRAAELLRERGIEDHEIEARFLMAHLLNCRPAEVFLKREDFLEPSLSRAYMEMVSRRARREPLQYITGTQEFMGLEFEVGPGVLIPRPETELLVEETLKRVSFMGPDINIVDLCTGSGCIAVSIAKVLDDAKIFATDISGRALDTARRNAARHGVSERIEFLRGDLFSALKNRGLEGKVDIMVSNPPYVAEEDFLKLEPEVKDFEPEEALCAGPDGLNFIKAIIEGAARWLKPGGELLIEIGYGQSDRVRGLFKDACSFEDIRIKKDFSGIDRIVRARFIGETS